MMLYCHNELLLICWPLVVRVLAILGDLVSLAYTNLKTIQKTLGLPVHWLVQDEPTRWKITLVEQKMALTAFTTKYGISQLSSQQVTHTNKVVKVMIPAEEVTKSISTESAAVSVIIPFIHYLNSKSR